MQALIWSRLVSHRVHTIENGVIWRNLSWMEDFCADAAETRMPPSAIEGIRDVCKAENEKINAFDHISPTLTPESEV